MKVRYIVLLLSGFLISCLQIFAQDDGQAPTFVPVPVSETFYEAAPIHLEILVNDQSDIAEVFLFYRFSPTENFTAIPMQLDVNYTARIPALDVKAGTLYYYFLARDEYGNQASWPEEGECQPARLQVLSTQRGVQAIPSDIEIRILSPDPEIEDIVAQPPLILAIFDPNEIIDLSSIELELDGQNISQYATFSRELITYVPNKPYRAGSNHLQLRFRDISVNSYQKEIEFQVGKVEKKVAKADEKSLKERINLRVNLDWDSDFDKYSGKEQPDNRPIDTHRINARLKFNLGQVQFNASTLLNTHFFDDNAVELDKQRQPLNRLRVDIRSPWLDLFYGDYTPEFSQLTLKGTRVRGLTTQLKLGWWKTTYINGETKHLIQSVSHVHPDSSSWTRVITGSDTSYVDHQKGTPARKIQGIRTELDFFRHFNVGLSGFKAYDERSSLNIPYSSLESKYLLLGNLVGGADATLHFNHDRTVLSAEYAFTTSNDILADDSILVDLIGLGEDQLNNIADFLGFYLTDDLALGSAEGRGFSTTFPDTNVMKNPGEYLFGDFLKNGTYRFEFRTPLSLKFANIDLKSEYNRVPANYNSLGNSTLRTDYQGMRSQLRVRLFKNQIFLSTSLEGYFDNIAGNTKSQTTQTQTVTAGFGLNFRKLPSINYSIRNMAREGDYPEGVLPEESNVVLNNNATITHTISPNYRFTINKTSFNLNGNMMFMNYDDQNSSKERNTNFQNNSFTGGLTVNFEMPLSITLGAGNSKNSPNDPLQMPTVFNIYSGKVTYKFFDKKLNTFVGFNYVKGLKDKNGVYDRSEEFVDTNGNEQYDDGEDFTDMAQINNKKFTMKLGAQMKIAKNLSMNLNVDQLNVKDFLKPEKDYSELRAKMRFSVWF